MQKRVVAVLATVMLVLGLGFGSAIAKQGGEGQGKEDKCERAPKSKGCPEHPGGGEEDPEDPGGEPSCADLAAVAQELADACQAVVDALTGGGGEDPPGEDPPSEDPPSEDPSCADLSQIDPALAQACEDITGGGGEEPSCEQLPDPALVAACNDVTGNLPA